MISGKSPQRLTRTNSSRPLFTAVGVVYQLKCSEYSLPRCHSPWAYRLTSPTMGGEDSLQNCRLINCLFR